MRVFESSARPRGAAAAALLALLLLVAPSLPAAAGPPAAIPEAGPDRAGRAFDAFARTWMVKIRNAASEMRHAVAGGGVSYRSYGDGFRTELKPTGHPAAPYVGILRYEERTHTCADRSRTRCRVAATTPVTEIFRFQNGRWVY